MGWMQVYLGSFAMLSTILARASRRSASPSGCAHTNSAQSVPRRRRKGKVCGRSMAFRFMIVQRRGWSVLHLSFRPQFSMSVQILVQGKILGAEEFLLAGAPEEPLFAGRLRWVNLLSEVLPRALIAELGLSKMLLGSSGGEQFLVVLPQEVRPQVEEFLTAASADIDRLSQGRLRLLWAITENLGDWTVVRKRLNEEFEIKIGRAH